MKGNKRDKEKFCSIDRFPLRLNHYCYNSGFDDSLLHNPLIDNSLLANNKKVQDSLIISEKNNSSELISYYIKEIPPILSNSEIINRAKFYSKKLEKLSSKYANKLKQILKNEIPKLLNSQIKLDFWYKILGFHWDNEIRRVTDYNQSYAVSFEKLEKIKSVLLDLFNEEINLPRNENEFNFICYNCGNVSKYQITNMNNFPKRPRKKCPYCNKMITLRILVDNGIISVEPYIENNTIKEITYNNFQTSVNEIFCFIEEYINFSKYTTGLVGHRVKFSLKNKSNLGPRSWLIENIRYAFPRFYGLALSNRILDYFLFRELHDVAISGSKLKSEFFENDRIRSKPRLSVLLCIDYNISRLSTRDFQDFDITISDDSLDRVKGYCSYILYFFIFRNPYGLVYISNTTSGGFPVNEDFFVPDFFLIRAIFFIMCNVSNSILSFSEIRKKLKIRNRFQRYLLSGTRLINFLGKTKPRIEEYIKIHNESFLMDFLNEINMFYKISQIRDNEFATRVGFASRFQKRVHQFFENFFGVKFESEKNVVALIRKNVINISGVKNKIHYNLSFDGYYKLDDFLRNRYRIDPKLNAIAFEAHGDWHINLSTYLRMFPYKTISDFNRRQEVDQLKREICTFYNIILMEIYENVEERYWKDEITKKLSNY